MKELWKDIEGYNGLYKVSNYGIVKSYKGVISRIISQHTRRDGYISIKLYKNGSCKTKKVHTLVAEAFCENYKNKKEVNHIDGDKGNNIYTNLEWSTRSENIKHACDIGLIKRDGSNNPRAKINENDASEIKFHLSIGCCRKEIANFFGITKSSVDNIACGKSWKKIKIHNQIYI